MEVTLGRWNIDGVEFDVETAWGLTVARGRFDRVAGSYKVGPEGTQIELTGPGGRPGDQHRHLRRGPA
jgi:hypothetical protein